MLDLKLAADWVCLMMCHKCCHWHCQCYCPQLVLTPHLLTRLLETIRHLRSFPLESSWDQESSETLTCHRRESTSLESTPVSQETSQVNRSRGWQVVTCQVTDTDWSQVILGQESKSKEGECQVKVTRQVIIYVQVTMQEMYCVQVTTWGMCYQTVAAGYSWISSA